MKKILPVAVLAALAGVNAAQAVHVNGDGTGQVLVYPFYSVEGGQDTYINLVNTTNEYKAVKVRILESMNSQEVLDFNLYLSPYDHWSAAISASGTGAAIQSFDKSCTVPLDIAQSKKTDFRIFQFDNDSVNGKERTREGYVEVIEMATITATVYQNAILHAQPAGIPGNCTLLDQAWAPGGSWDITDGNAGVTNVSGGLYGWGVLINVAAGTDATYDAVALDDWIDPTKGYLHSGPGDLAPDITSEAEDEYDVFDEGGVISGTAFSSRDAVSATMMLGTIANDYVLEADIGAGTDWVVNFPTKRFYTNEGSVADQPFTVAWNSNISKACEEFSIQYWNREERTPSDPIDPNDFSPQPDPEADPTFAFCYEANVLTFNESNVLIASARSGVNLNLETGFENGWARINFQGEGHQLETLDHTFNGLPVIGFAVQKYVNDNLAGGINASYQGSILHKGDRVLSS